MNFLTDEKQKERDRERIRELFKELIDMAAKATEKKIRKCQLYLMVLVWYWQQII